jgi:hypothetical protein
LAAGLVNGSGILLTMAFTKQPQTIGWLQMFHTLFIINHFFFSSLDTVGSQMVDIFCAEDGLCE